MEIFCDFSTNNKFLADPYDNYVWQDTEFRTFVSFVMDKNDSVGICAKFLQRGLESMYSNAQI